MKFSVPPRGLEHTAVAAESLLKAGESEHPARQSLQRVFEGLCAWLPVGESGDGWVKQPGGLKNLDGARVL